MTRPPSYNSLPINPIYAKTSVYDDVAHPSKVIDVDDDSANSYEENHSCFGRNRCFLFIVVTSLFCLVTATIVICLYIFHIRDPPHPGSCSKCEGVTPQYFENIDVVARGIDLPKMTAFANVSSKNKFKSFFANPVFHIAYDPDSCTADCTYKAPLGFHAKRVASCNAESSHSTVTSANDFQQLFDAAVNVGIDIPFVFQGDLNMNFALDSNEVTRGEAVLVYIYSACSVYEVQSYLDDSIQLAPGFKKRLSNLQRQSENACSVLGDYGTHFIDRIVMGGMKMHKVRITRNLYEKEFQTKAGLDAYVDVQLKKLAFDIGVDFRTVLSKGKSYSQEDIRVQSYSIGTSSLLEEATAFNISRPLSLNDIDNPYPISAEFSPIEKLNGIVSDSTAHLLALCRSTYKPTTELLTIDLHMPFS